MPPASDYPLTGCSPAEPVSVLSNTFFITLNDIGTKRKLTGKQPHNFWFYCRGRCHGWRTPVKTMGIGIYLPKPPPIDKGSSTTKPIHAVTNPRISDWSTVVNWWHRPLQYILKKLKSSLIWQLKKRGREYYFLLTSVNHIIFVWCSWLYGQEWMNRLKVTQWFLFLGWQVSVELK